MTKEKQILPQDKALQYMGRIDWEDREHPVWVNPCTCVRVHFTGTYIKALVTNVHGCWTNYVGVIIDGNQKKIQLENHDRVQELMLGEHLEEGEHELLFFKRMDAAHHLIFHGLMVEEDSVLRSPKPLPKRRIEVYGDSVSAGEVSEAVEYCGLQDPQHDGEYSNSYYSYAWCTARKLNAQLHDVAQGGIALLDETGYFNGPDYLGMEWMYDKIQYTPYMGETKTWDFSRYTPHVVIVAIGQNDNHPDNYMDLDYDLPKAQYWREHYEAFIRRLRDIYPNAHIILSTTILNHHSNWDKSIEQVCRKIGDTKIHHFMYSKNGCGTHGHIRIPEAEQMAEELSAFIEGLDHVWEEEEEKGIVNTGNRKPIQNAMKKAQAGEDVTVAFLGGSITQGSLSSTPETCYAYLVYEWWKARFPKAKITYVNGGIGGTTSQFGVARVDSDILSHRPDFLLTEFSVNDENTPHFKETFEGLVRHILNAENAPALMLMHNYYYGEKTSAEEIHLEVGRHYDLPCVSMKSTIGAAIEKGILTVGEISPDGLHPNDKGHGMIADVIIHMLEKIYKDMEEGEEEAYPYEKRPLPLPLTKNRYEDSVRYQNTNSQPDCRGFVSDATPQQHITETFRNGYTACETGSKLTLQIEANTISVQYRKSIHKPAPIAKVVIDKDVMTTKVLDANFDEDWGDCLYIDTVLESDQCENHQVEIEIIQGVKESETPFYLVSLIGTRRME